MIFVDTSAWYAFADPSDSHHELAVLCAEEGDQSFLTTDFIVDETLTLLKARGLTHRAVSMGEAFFGGNLTRIHYLTVEDILDAWRAFRDYSDKDWSFTDATSKVVIEKLGIRQAFAFDQHFLQFGSVEIVPAR
jgi:hypothetical protein